MNEAAGGTLPTSGENSYRVKLGNALLLCHLLPRQEAFVVLLLALNKTEETLFSAFSIFPSLIPHRSSPFLTPFSQAFILR